MELNKVLRVQIRHHFFEIKVITVIANLLQTSQSQSAITKYAITKSSQIVKFM